MLVAILLVGGLAVVTSVTVFTAEDVDAPWVLLYGEIFFVLIMLAEQAGFFMLAGLVLCIEYYCSLVFLNRISIMPSGAGMGRDGGLTTSLFFSISITVDARLSEPCLDVLEL